jgi:L-asparaginase/Glu-tRNA(Gln) amidotransferase subunit D
MKSFTQLLPLFASLALATPIDLAKSDLHKLFVRQDIQTPINASLPNITIFATGGTIASQGTSNTQTTGYSIGLGVQQLVNAVPELLNISNIAGYQISNVDSGNINQTISLKLAQMINEELAKPEISGVVITHGTDTLEETAFFLESTVKSSKPVVCVGAMRPATALSADGPLNLYQAVVLAGSAAARDRGTMIVLNDRIGSAFYTTKNNANSLDTFYSTEAGTSLLFSSTPPKTNHPKPHRPTRHLRQPNPLLLLRALYPHWPPHLRHHKHHLPRSSRHPLRAPRHGPVTIPRSPRLGRPGHSVRRHGRRRDIAARAPGSPETLQRHADTHCGVSSLRGRHGAAGRWVYDSKRVL